MTADIANETSDEKKQWDREKREREGAAATEVSKKGKHFKNSLLIFIDISIFLA